MIRQGDALELARELPDNSVMGAYQAFLSSKVAAHHATGVSVDPTSIHSTLFPFQSALTRWALRKGRACLFAGTGLGKTRMQLEWCRHIPGHRLIIAPLAVAEQTIIEAQHLSGLPVRRVLAPQDISAEGVYIVNYDRAHLTESVKWDAVCLDESSILKSHDGAYRQYLQDRFASTPMKLACTATPSPNDYMELGTHAEWVGAMSRLEMLATFFMHDGGDTSKWRLKRHARGDFWRWVSSWAAVLAHPRDIGYETHGYDLPDLIIHDHTVTVESAYAGGLFGDTGVNATSIHAVLRESAESRVQVTQSLVSSDPDAPWLIWCNTDHEQDLLERALPGVASVRGSDPIPLKEDRLLGFASGKYQHLVTKPRIAGFGMNWQHCSQMIFCGVSYSFEQMYQAIRRCWRFGQPSPVHVHLVTCNAQESVKAVLKAKDEAFRCMAQEMALYCKQEVST